MGQVQIRMLVRIPAAMQPRWCYVLQVFRFQHWLAEKTEYKAAFRGRASGAFECKPSTVAAAPAGLDGQELQVEVTFEPGSIGDDYHETLVVSSTTGGEYECQVNGRCLPPKPSGPFEVVKVMQYGFLSTAPIAPRQLLSCILPCLQ